MNPIELNINFDLDKIKQNVELELADNIGRALLIHTNSINADELAKKAFESLDFDAILKEVKDRLQHEVAERIVSNILSGIGHDVAKVMQNESIREDFKFLIRKEAEEILSKIKD